MITFKDIQEHREASKKELAEAAKNKTDGMALSGHVKAWITDNITGKKRLVFDDKNAITGDYADIIVDSLQTATNYGIDNMFNGNATPPPDGEDGIAIYDNVGGNWYEMNMAATVESGGWVTFTGTFTGVGITVSSVLFGHNWLAAAPNDFVSVGAAYGYFASPAGWTNQAVLITETLTIEWIIKHQAT